MKRLTCHISPNIRVIEEYNVLEISRHWEAGNNDHLLLDPRWSIYLFITHLVSVLHLTHPSKALVYFYNELYVFSI